MKANRKFVEGREAVSAVIGVILMVAITVAIAAAVYVYVSGMIGGTTQRTPTLQCTPDDTNDRLVVTHCDAGVEWSDINISITNSTGTYYYTGMSGTVTAGDYIDLSSYGSGEVTVTLRYDPTNTLLGTWKVNV